ncbi:MAG TPA: hypothetical protein VGR21_06025 [Cryptosporangiaceae bacterium]|nr:hypothetical protein [Cryptosporangiaceae bacterium]
MPEVRRGGRRRLDRVLAPEYTDDLAGLPLDEVRSRRAEAELEAAELTALLGLLHGRVEVVNAELGRRRGGEPRVERPTDDGAPTAGSWPEVVVETDENAHDAAAPPPWAAPESGRADRGRRRVERLVVDVDLADVDMRTDDELERVLRTYRTEEERVVGLRSQVWQVVERCGEDLARRGLAASARRTAAMPAAGDDR